MSGTILIVDGMATNRIVLKARLSAACYAVSQAATGAEALRAVRAAPPDLMLLDTRLPDTDGLALLRRLRADPVTADLPVLVSGAAADRRLRLAALAAGADGFLDRPADDALMLARIRGLLRDRAGSAAARALPAGLSDGPAAPAPAPPPLLAMVTDRVEAALRWRAALAPHLAARVALASRDAALAAGAAPDLFLLGGQGALPLLADLRSRPATGQAAFCLVLPDAAGDEAAMALDLGAGDVLPDGFDAAEAAARLSVLVTRKRARDAQRAAVRRGLELATLDPLTGLHNRRHALPALACMAAAGQPCAALVIDIDRFKAVNDGHGHAAGDAVLAEVARRLRAHAPPDALVARIGGEEFLVAFAPADAAGARAAAQAIRTGVASAPVALPLGGAVAVTVSVGVAVSAGGDPAALTAAADRALLTAKAEGRNQVTVGTCAA